MLISASVYLKLELHGQYNILPFNVTALNQYNTKS